MSRPDTELAHLFRALQAPAAARALPKLADRARRTVELREHFAAALLKAETDSRDSHGRPGPHHGRPLRRPQTLEDFDFAFQTRIRRHTVLHPPFWRRRHCR